MLFCPNDSSKMTSVLCKVLPTVLYIDSNRQTAAMITRLIGFPIRNNQKGQWKQPLFHYKDVPRGINNI